MSVKRNKESFEDKKKRVYQNIIVTAKIFQRINEQNRRLWELEEKKKAQEIKKEEKEKPDGELTPDRLYVLHGIDDKKIKKIVKDMFVIMDKYDFKNSSSVPNKADYYFKRSNTTYELLSKVDLEFHSIHCAMCAIEITDGKELPNKIRDMIILLSLLHDFGKEEIIARRYRMEEGEKHHITSSRFVEQEFKKYIDEELSKDEYKVLIEVLKNHHKDDAIRHILLKFLIKADTEARQREYDFRVEMMYQQVSKNL